MISVELPDPAGIEMPEGDRLAVGAPAVRVAQVELLLVHPVGGAVDDRARAVCGQPRDQPVGEVLDVEVVGVHVRDPRAVRGELGEHQRGGFCVPADLVELPALEVQHPVIAARIPPPDLLRVGEEEQLRAVLRPRVVVDLRRLGFRSGLRLRHERRRRDQHAARAGRRLVTHDVVAALDSIRGGVLDGRIGLAAVEPPGGAEDLRLEFLLREDSVQARGEIVGKLPEGAARGSAARAKEAVRNRNARTRKGRVGFTRPP